MLAPLVLLSMALPGRAGDAVVELRLGSALYRTCKAEVRLMELPSLDKATGRDLIDGSYCVGYLNGFTGGLNAPVCTQRASIGEVVRVYVAYMGRNPQLLTEDRRLGLQRALQEAFPCSTIKLPGSESLRNARPLT